MKKGENYNRPAPGSQIRVEPIKNQKDIETIKKLLSNKPLYYALFTVGINTNLRASDLLAIKAGKVRGLKPMDEITLIEKKTGKQRRINLNRSCIEAIHHLLASRAYSDDDYLFTGQRGKMSVPYLSYLVKKWCKMVNLPGNYGSHTLRKTWGYFQRVHFGAGLPELMEAYNHSTQRQTLAYLCIQPEEIKKIYSNEI